MARVHRTQMGRAEELDSYEKLQRRARKHDAKIQRGTEQILEDMVEQNKKLSGENLLLKKMYRLCYRLLPKDARDEVDLFKSQLGDLEDVHPE